MKNGREPKQLIQTNDVSTLASNHNKGHLALPYYEKPVIDVSAVFGQIGHNRNISLLLFVSLSNGSHTQLVER